MSDLSLPTGSLRDQLAARTRRTRSVYLLHNADDAATIAEHDKAVTEATMAASVQCEVARVVSPQHAAQRLEEFPLEAMEDLIGGEDEKLRDLKMARISIEVASELLDAKAVAEQAREAASRELDVWEFEFAAVGHEKRRKLEDEAPPTDDELEDARRQQRAVAELNKGRPKAEQYVIPQLPSVSPDGLRIPLIEASLVAVRRWQNGRDGQPTEFGETPDRQLLDEMFGAMGWTASDLTALFEAANFVDVTPSKVTFESVGKG